MAPTLKGVTAALVRNLLELLRTPPVEVADVRKLGELVRRDPVALHHALGKDLAPALVTCLQGRATFEILRVLDFIGKASSRGRSEVRAALRPRKLSTIIRKRPHDLECCHLATRLLCLVARGPHAKALTSGDLEPVLQSMVKFGKEAPVLAADACRFTFLYLETLGDNFTAIIRALKSGGASSDDAAADNIQAFGPDAALLPLTQVEGLYALARNLLVEGDILTMLANTFRHVEAPLKRMVRAGVLALSAFGRSRLSKHFLKIFRVSETADPRDKRMNSLFEVYKGAISFTPVSDLDSSSTTSYGLDSFPTDFDAQSQESGDDLAVDAPAMTFPRTQMRATPHVPRSVRPQTAHAAGTRSKALIERQIHSAPRQRERRPRAQVRKRPSRWRKKQSVDVLKRAANTVAPNKYSERDIDKLLRRLERVPELPKRRFFAPTTIDTTGLYPFEDGGCGEVINSPSVDMEDLLAEFNALSATEATLLNNLEEEQIRLGQEQQLMPGWSREHRSDDHHDAESGRRISKSCHAQRRRPTREEVLVEDFQGGLEFGDRIKIMIEDVHERLRADTEHDS